MTQDTEVQSKNWKDFETQLREMAAGNQFPPNFEELPLEAGIATIASGANLAHFGQGNFKHPNKQATWGHWARFFVSKTQDGALDGSGYVIWYDSGAGKVGKFSICKHKNKAGAGANPMRGWHPSRCSLCGLDTTVDSGD